MAAPKGLRCILFLFLFFNHRYKGEYRQRHLGESRVNMTHKLNWAMWRESGEERWEPGAEVGEQKKERPPKGQEAKMVGSQDGWGFGGKSSWGRGGPVQSLRWRSLRWGEGYVSQEDPVTGGDWGMLEERGSQHQILIYLNQVAFALG